MQRNIAKISALDSKVGQIKKIKAIVLYQTINNRKLGW